MTDKFTFKSKNGDSLQMLNLLMSDVDKRLTKVQEKIETMRTILEPYEKEKGDATMEKLNIAARFRVWWMEFREVNQ